VVINNSVGIIAKAGALVTNNRVEDNDEGGINATVGSMVVDNVVSGNGEGIRHFAIFNGASLILHNEVVANGLGIAASCAPGVAHTAIIENHISLGQGAGLIFSDGSAAECGDVQDNFE